MWDGTIINCPEPEVTRRLGSPKASIGLVSPDPAKSAAQAAEFLKLPIAFVTTNAFTGTVLNFRKHAIHMPRPQSQRR